MRIGRRKWRRRRKKKWCRRDIVQFLAILCDDLIANNSRIVQKRHHTVLEYELGMGEAGGLYALVDDGNPAWEDVEEEDEVLATVMARHDEAENGDVVKEVGEKVLKAYSSYTFVTGSKVKYYQIY
jgi:hypothetical protein